MQVHTNQVQGYLSKLSGPLVDRIDIHVEVPTVPFEQLRSERDGTSSAMLREQVMIARKKQALRFNSLDVRTNSEMSSRQVREYCKLDEDGQQILKQSVYELGLSARAHDKVLKVARTLADMESAETISPDHLAEAIQYRRLDRQL